MSHVPDGVEIATLGIIGSSGGSALSAAVNCLRAAGIGSSFVVVTDRECGLLDWSRRQGYPTTLVPYASPESFSEKVWKVFESAAVTNILLFYTRRVAGPLLHPAAAWNIHPSLLPAFPGMRGVEKTLAAGARMLGATLHRVSEQFDSGPICAQTGCALPPETSLPYARKMSFLQKTWLTLVWYEMVTLARRKDCAMPLARAEHFASPLNAYPCLQDPQLLHAFDQLQQTEACRVIDICRN